MKLSHHVTVSAFISVILQLTIRSWGLTVASFLTGILLDLDHYVDYLIEYGSPFNIKKFFHCIYEEKLEKIYLVMHGWEWSVLLTVLGWVSDWNPWVTGVLIGYGHHMVLDAIFNDHWPLLGYSVVWRWKRGLCVRNDPSEKK